uniref:Uncharacterized protein n=1 Tax=Nanobsidianus stetteri TaxID=1294122 RepID=A0A2T9WKC9_NANST
MYLQGYNFKYAKNNIVFLDLRNNLNYLRQTPNVKNLSSTRTIYNNYIPPYAKDIKVKSYDGFYFVFFMFFYIIIFQFIGVFCWCITRTSTYSNIN